MGWTLWQLSKEDFMTLSKRSFVTTRGDRVPFDVIFSAQYPCISYLLQTSWKPWSNSIGSPNSSKWYKIRKKCVHELSIVLIVNFGGLEFSSHWKIWGLEVLTEFHPLTLPSFQFFLGFSGTNSAFDQQPEAIINRQRPENRKCPDVPPKRSLFSTLCQWFGTK